MTGVGTKQPYLLAELLKLLRVGRAQNSLHGSHRAHHLLLSHVSLLSLLLLLLLLGAQFFPVILLRTAVSDHAEGEAIRGGFISRGVWRSCKHIIVNTLRCGAVLNFSVLTAKKAGRETAWVARSFLVAASISSAEVQNLRLVWTGAQQQGRGDLSLLPDSISPLVLLSQAFRT